MARSRRLLCAGAAAMLLGGCSTVPLAEPTRLLSEDQIIDMMKRPRRWLGRTVTIRIYPYDNGFTGSFVACLEPCDPKGADESIFVLYTRQHRFAGYRGTQAEVVQAVFGKICPEDQPICLDAPIRLFSLREVQ